MMIGRQNAVLVLSIDRTNGRRIKGIHRGNGERLYNYRTKCAIREEKGFLKEKKAS